MPYCWDRVAALCALVWEGQVLPLYLIVMCCTLHAAGQVQPSFSVGHFLKTSCQKVVSLISELYRFILIANDQTIQR